MDLHVEIKKKQSFSLFFSLFLYLNQSEMKNEIFVSKNRIERQ